MADAGAQADRPYVGRGGLKLAHALSAFALDPAGLRCADFGCNVGGFTDCLLRAGAARVHALDTGYGALDYRLRTDPRVAVMERTNALHAPPPEGGVDLVVIDLAWTPQRLAVPAALRWLGSRERGRIITLIKPHYEASAADGGRAARGGVLPDEEAREVARRVAEAMPTLGAACLGLVESPVRGGASKGRDGNLEFLSLLRAM